MLTCSWKWNGKQSNELLAILWKCRCVQAFSIHHTSFDVVLEAWWRWRRKKTRELLGFSSMWNCYLISRIKNIEWNIFCNGSKLWNCWRVIRSFGLEKTKVLENSTLAWTRKLLCCCQQKLTISIYELLWCEKLCMYKSVCMLLTLSVNLTFN